MKFIDVAGLALNNMQGRKLRSLLTVLGIVIAVAAIVILISLANGVTQQVSSRLNQLGNDVIQITPGADRATRTGGGGGLGIGAPAGGFATRGGGNGAFGGDTSSPELTFSDADDLRSLDGVQSVDARISGRMKASYKGKNASLQVTGIDPNTFKEMNTATLIAGKLLNENDKYSVVLGYRVHTSTFAGEELLNRQIKIGDYYFRVVGLLNQSSGSLITSDTSVYVPIDVAKNILNESVDAQQVFVKVKPGRNSDDVAAIIEKKLLDLHRVSADQADFTITTASFYQSAVSDITNTLSLFLGGIAAISLLVGAIGVANTMFMSVLERTKEIGILKALGMKDSEVTVMFLVEAATIGLLGGIIGIALSLVASYVLSMFNVPSVITLDLLAGSLLFSAFIGIVAGAIPARGAAHLQPVEALRYE